MKSITLSSKYQVVIPSSVRAKLGMKAGDKLIVARLTDNEVVLRKEPRYSDLIGVIPQHKSDATQRVRELRDSWK